MLRTLLLLLAAGLAFAPSARAEDIAVGEPAPALPEASWVLPPEALTLEGLRGHLVLLHLLGADDAAKPRPWLDVWQEAFWKKGLRVVALARTDDEALDLAVRQHAFVYPVASVESLGAYEDAAKTGATVLIDPAGTILWHGKLDEIDTGILRKALRPLKPPAVGPSAEALDAWTRLAGRCVEVGAHALAIDVYDRIQKVYKDLPEAEAAEEQEKVLKKDKQAKREIAAARPFVSLATEWLKVGENDRKKKALGKRFDKFLAKHEGTRAGSHAALLLGDLRGGAALTAMREFIAKQRINTKQSSWRTSLPKPPKMEFEPTRIYLWVLETSEGPIRVKLLTQIAPMHVSSTIYLTELGYFDGLTFHRVIPGFMAQGGCPLGTGRGNPGYKFGGEFDRSTRHNRGGLLSMANSGPGTDGSQFFLTFKPARHLDDKHTIYGEVVDGMATLKKLEAQGSQSGSTSKRLGIEKATIEVE